LAHATGITVGQSNFALSGLFLDELTAALAAGWKNGGTTPGVEQRMGVPADQPNRGSAPVKPGSQRLVRFPGVAGDMGHNLVVLLNCQMSFAALRRRREGDP
jgi:hypothetical protein